MFGCGYLAVCTARDLGWKRVHGIVNKLSRALEQFFFVTGEESLTYDSWFDHFWLTCPSRPDSGTFQVNQIYSCEMANLYV